MNEGRTKNTVNEIFLVEVIANCMDEIISGVTTESNQRTQDGLALKDGET